MFQYRFRAWKVSPGADPRHDPSMDQLVLGRTVVQAAGTLVFKHFAGQFVPIIDLEQLVIAPGNGYLYVAETERPKCRRGASLN